MKETINQYIEKGLPIFPCGKDKAPAYGTLWKDYKAEKDKDIDKYEGIGLRMGQNNMNFYCIDFDLKNTSDPHIFTNYIKELQIHCRNINVTLDVREDLDRHLIYQRTRNKGYHIIFRTSDTDANKKLALSEAGKVIIETRGTGGYILIAPSKGYTLLNKSAKGNGLDIWDAPYITNDEKFVIENLAYSFNKKHLSPYRLKDGESVKKTYFNTKKPDGIPPWEDYDNIVNGVSLLESYGWSVFKESGARVYMTRPDKAFGISGNWHLGLKLFYNFSSNVTQLPETDKAYTPFAIYTYYEHSGDFSSAAKKLYEEGYGDRIEHEEEIEFDNPEEFLYSFDGIQKELEKFYKGEIEKGKSTGSELLDRFFLFKKNEFIQIVGDTNIGKTFWMKYIIALSIRFAGWKVIIAAQENKPWDFLDDMLSFLNAKSGRKSYTSKEIKYREQMDFLKSRIRFIRSGGKSIFEVMEMAKKINDSEIEKKGAGYDMLLLDPLNGFKTDVNLKLGVGHEYHQNTAMELLHFANEVMTVFLNTHTTVGNQRGRKGSQQETGGKRRIPRPTDAENGGSYANKADTIIVLDRENDSEVEYERKTTLMWVKKIRNAKLGGSINPDLLPVNFEFDKDVFGFHISWNGQQNPNPLEDKDAFKEAIQDRPYENSDMDSNEGFYEQTDNNLF